jgi:hypothetical protein
VGVNAQRQRGPDEERIALQGGEDPFADALSVTCRRGARDVVTPADAIDVLRVRQILTVQPERQVVISPPG